MRSFNSASKALTCLFSCRDLFRRRIIKFTEYNQIRCLSTIGGSSAFSSANKSAGAGYWNFSLWDSGILSNNHNVIVQKRGFLGCGDGEEGNMLAKVYEERRVMGYASFNYDFPFSFLLFFNQSVLCPILFIYRMYMPIFLSLEVMK